MKLPVALLLASLTFAAQAAPFAGGNADSGKRLFEENRCNGCHASMLGGDGSAIFTRSNHKVKNPQQLVNQMHVCAGGAGITLTPQDEQNLGAYLNQGYYHFK